MSVTSTIAVVETAGNGSQTAFGFNFKLLAATDLVVRKKAADGTYSANLVLGVDYTVSFDTDAEVGTVTFTVAPVTGGTAYIQRTTSINQGAVLPRESVLPAKTLETMVDKVTLLVQEAQLIPASAAAVAAASSATTTLALFQKSGAFADLDAAAGTAWFVAKITDLRAIMVYLGDRTLGNNGWIILGGY